MAVLSDMVRKMHLTQIDDLCKNLILLERRYRDLLTKTSSHIVNPNPYDFLALSETASFHQVSVLRDAIWRYFALQTSIRVTMPVSENSYVSSGQ